MFPEIRCWVVLDKAVQDIVTAFPGQVVWDRQSSITRGDRCRALEKSESDWFRASEKSAPEWKVSGAVRRDLYCLSCVEH